MNSNTLIALTIELLDSPIYNKSQALHTELLTIRDFKVTGKYANVTLKNITATNQVAFSNRDRKPGDVLEITGEISTFGGFPMDNTTDFSKVSEPIRMEASDIQVITKNT